MAQNEVIERKNEILKRKIESLILRQNSNGLDRQDNQLMQRFIRELHVNNYSLR